MSTVDPLEQILIDGLEALKLSADNKTIDKLLQFQKLLGKWNHVYNLSAIRDPLEMIRLHLLDSLAVHQYLSGTCVADVGTGAGLPGIPLALMNNKKRFFLIDSDSKKTRFVHQVVIELELKNVSIIRGRVENVELEQKMDTVITRAFSSLTDILAKTRHLLGTGGVVLALKGKSPLQELMQTVATDYTVRTLNVPGVNAERHLVTLIP